MEIQAFESASAGLTHRRLNQIRMVFLASGIAGRSLPPGSLDWARQPGGITFWEELGSLRLNADRRRLDILLLLKGADGYSAGPDLPVTQEYLRLFVDPGDGRFLDAGLLELPVADGQGGTARAWACSRTRLSMELPQGLAVPERVRAILSWQVPPPAGDPDYQPVFGQRCDHHPVAGAGSTPWLGGRRGAPQRQARAA